jgi:hypothetical protein
VCYVLLFQQSLRFLVRPIPRPCLLRGVRVVGLIILTGCQSDTRNAALEGQLRRHEKTIRDLRAKVGETEELLADQDRELAVARSASPSGVEATGNITQVSFATESEVAWGSVNSLQLYKLTSGLIRSPEGDDVVLNMVWQPLDQDEEVVKVAGELEVRAATVTKAGLTKEVAHNKYTLTESRQLWSHGLLSSGFQVNIPIPAPIDAADHILVTATLNLGSGRLYNASAVIPLE